ncbi:MAG TPA: GTP cyclohydrolase II [Polyangiales bacterium]|jgi:GTP cyclohydrolase II|nr:GTP cyclohydrolase II [Polyangiales bacterium]
MKPLQSPAASDAPKRTNGNHPKPTPSQPASSVMRYSEAEVPTEYGTFRLVVYREIAHPDIEHLAIVRGNVQGARDLLMRVHSECFTGEVLHSLKCDCREQLDTAMRAIAAREQGAVLYLRQEGRGIGLGNKIRAYALQQQGVDTVDANLKLGFEADARRYHVASAMLADLGVASVCVLTNNPAKVDALRADGVIVSGRVPMEIEPNQHNREYLDTKRERMGHLIRLR